MSVNRRQFIKAGSLALGSLAVHSLPLQARPAEDKATVYFTPEITTESLLRIYEKVCAPLQGRIAIKLHTGEPHGPNILPRDMVRALQARIPKSSIVECNVLYPSPRQTTEGHRETLRTNGWTFCPVDIMDADGEVSLPIPGGRHLREVAVGKNLLNYDSMLVLTHFKGHVMGGFGGSLKNIAIGCASGKTGKAQLHSDGTNLWAGGPLFMERMVEGGKAITTHFKGHMAYINVLRRMSVDCDCAGTSAAEPTAPDIGILASTDLLAVDQASPCPNSSATILWNASKAAAACASWNIWRPWAWAMPATILFPCPDRRSCHATFRSPARPLRRPACRCLYRPFHSIRPRARPGDHPLRAADAHQGLPPLFHRDRAHRSPVRRQQRHALQRRQRHF